jgi:hypothetical protein
MKTRVAIVTSGHLATCPRMVKAADALHAAGCRVRVISTSQTPWAAEADRRVHGRRGWRWDVIAYDRRSAPLRWAISGVRHRAGHALARAIGTAGPRSWSLAAFSRLHHDIVAAILRETQDVIYGGTSGALAAVAEAGRRSGTPFALDFEDFHCGEHAPGSAGSYRDVVADNVMRDALRGASFVTVASAAIGRACDARFGVRTIPVNNVFPLPGPPGREDAGPLRLYWFSQTIGPDRGIEDVVRAAGLARIAAELHVRGVPAAGYLDALEALARSVAPTLRLVHHAPDDPDRLVDGCRAFDVGLALEPGHTINNALSLSNKALTYPLAGLAMVITDTPGQQALAADLGADAIVYAPGDIHPLADGLARWDANRAVLRRARDASWNAARVRWHWEHPLERERFLAAMAAA